MVHLHLHTHFSFGVGVSSPEVLAAAAAERGHRVLACTDTNGVYGVIEFQRACDAAGVRPILGAHLITGEEETIALATDERGWGALCRAISEIHWSEQHGGTAVQPAPSLSRGRYSLPRACRGGGTTSFRLSAHLAADRAGVLLLSRDIAFLERMVAASGSADLYAELVPGKERHAVLAAARRLGLTAVATNAVVMAHPEDWARHRLVRAIHLNTTLSELDSGDGGARTAPSTGSGQAVPPPRQARGRLYRRTADRDAWLRPATDLTRHFPDCPEAVAATEELAERCTWRIPWGRIIPPRAADVTDAFARLRAEAYAGAERRYGTVAPVTRERLERELAIIGQKGFADYFLVVQDIVRHGPTHCGRGSVANSIVSYCLGITHVEPLGAGLLFERFLNPERKDPPDIDLDFPWDERDRVLAYVFQRYPRPQAAMVANHNCFRLRGALREVAKVHGRPAGEIREVTRRIPIFEDLPLETTLATHPNFKALDLPPAWRDFARQAEPLVGMPRHLSLHPGGVVIVPTALTDYVPIQPAVKELDPSLCSGQAPIVPVIQFEKDGAEDAGLVKIDLLGNRSLAVIRDAIAAVKTHTGRQIDYTTADAGEDEGTRELFRTGRTMGVFYTESPASRQLCAKSRADTFELLVLNTSIIRPASNRFIRTYLERLHGAPYEPLHPVLRDTLSDTFGIMVYQEDVVNVCAVFAGMPLATADGLRKSLSKKRPAKALSGYAEEFFAGALALGRDPETIRRVWEMIMSFAGYSFCKGHSASYIQVAQHSCYLRAHYPAEFMAAVLANGGGFYHPFAYVAEAIRMGLTVLPPDINASDFRCTGQGTELRIGLQFVKGLSAEGAERILSGRTGGRADRQEGGTAVQPAPSLSRGRYSLPYRSLFELQHRTGLAADDLRALIKVGALDSISEGWTRPMMLWMVDTGWRSGGTAEGRNASPSGAGDHDRTAPSTGSGQAEPPPRQARGRLNRPLDRLGAGCTAERRPPDWFSALPPAVPVLRDYAPERRRREEYAALGFVTDTHPMRLHADALASFRLCRSTELHRHVGRHVLLAGMLTTAKPVHTLQDEPMEFATFDDGDGLIETVLFPRVYRERGHVLFDQGPFIFRGKVEEEFGAVTVTITHLDRLERATARRSASSPPG